MGAAAQTNSSQFKVDPDNDYHEEFKIVAHPLSLTVSVTRTGSDPINVKMRRTGNPVQGPGEPLLLHWGVVFNPDDDRSVYRRPPDPLIPNGTATCSGGHSLQTPFDSDGALTLQVPQANAPAGIVFLVLIPGKDTWRNQWFKKTDGSSFYIDLTSAISQSEKQRRVKLEEERKAEEIKRRLDEEKRLADEKAQRERLIKAENDKRQAREDEAHAFLTTTLDQKTWTLFSSLDENYEFGNFHIRVFLQSSPDEEDDSARENTPAHILVASSLALQGSDIVLHWGVKKAQNSGWVVPDEGMFPPKTTVMNDHKAVQTVLLPQGDTGLRTTQIANPSSDVLGVFCVIHAPNASNHLQWIKAASGGDMFIPIKPPPPLPGLSKDSDISNLCKTMLDGVIEREMEYGSWTLMHRYGYARHLVDSVIQNDSDCWSALYVWMRYSQIRVLDWQRRYNTQPRQLSWAQLSLVTMLASKFKHLPELRWLSRLVISCVGRGGSGDLGQRIRDDILVILRHNRDWKHGSMMEQWHQKLHNNTSPDDVVICEALLSFWRNDGDIGSYWNVIHSNGITNERLASYEQPITTEPDYAGHLKDTMLYELGRYNDLLRQVHLGTDLNFLVGKCQGFMGDHARGSVNHFMHLRHTGGPLLDLLCEVAIARTKVCDHIIGCNSLNDENCRDLIFLDLALESEGRRLLESTHGTGHDGTLWSHLTAIKAAATSLKCSEAGLKTAGELERANHDINAVIERLGQEGESHDVGLRAAAGMTIMRNALTDIVDRYAQKLGPLSKCLGTAFHAENAIINTFIEESVRGGPGFSLSTLLRKADPAVRRVAQLGPFSVISPFEKETKGPVVVFNKLRESVGAKFKRGTVVIANKCDGDEDVPENTSYVVIGSTVDVLSHVAVRARNEHHGLVACLDEDKLSELRELHGCIVKAKLTGENFHVDVLDDTGQMSPSRGVQPVMKRIKSSGLVTPPSGVQTPTSSGLFAAKRSNSRSKLMSHGNRGGILQRSDLSDHSLELLGQKKRAICQRQLAAPWAIRPSKFDVELVGSKSLNLHELVALGLPEWIHTPVSVAIPNGAMRKVMNFDTNSDLRLTYEDLIKEVDEAKMGDIKLCTKLREVVMSLEAPEGLKEALRGVLDELGCETIDEALPGAWNAVKCVWASMWNERAHLARQKLKMSAQDVDMAVLCQKIVDADYAFVIHTTNPLTNDENEIYAEAVVGLGETLVSNAPGQALGFTVRKDEDMDEVIPIVRSYPSKMTALYGGDYIFRSDSNAEDLEGFAGAGLHDSVSLKENEQVDIDYSVERLMIDDDFREFLMRGIAKIGVEVEHLMGGMPQDIEGCFKDGKFYVVQARPQV